MRTRKPIQALSTQRLLSSVFPESFKMVNDKESNGYKYTNLLYGVEIDEARYRLSKIYHDNFMDTMDYSDDGVLYQVLLSGIPTNGYVYGDSIPVKLTDLSEFDYGDPTRLSFQEATSISGIIPNGYNIIGLEYYRSTIDGNGFFLANVDVRQADAVVSGLPTTIKIPIDRDGVLGSGEYINYGIKDQTYEEMSVDDLLVPEDSGTLLSRYPLTRTIKDEVGVSYEIDHYEPYHGWTRDINKQIVAVVDYDGEYYYDSAGKKTYHETSRNNPYGFGNYSTVYLPLLHTPISGTLKLYDINILDASGNYEEIPITGKTLYTYQSPNMLKGTATGVFDPIYMGYESTVPYDIGLYSAGETCTPVITTSWDYVREGSALNEDNGLYEESTSGNLTNVIKLINPYSRYIAEYQFETATKVKYLTSLDSTKYVRLSGILPIYTFDDTFNNLTDVSFEFSKNTTVTDEERKRIITFRGFDVRPNSQISQIDFNIPVTEAPVTTLKDVTINLLNRHLGYSDEFLPSNTNREYWIHLPFNSALALNQELDVSGSGNHFNFVSDGTYQRLKINYGPDYGKRHIHYTGDQYYECINSGMYADDFYIKFGAKIKSVAAMGLVDYYANYRYIYLEVLSDGRLRLTSNNITVESREPLPIKPFELIVHHVYTETPGSLLNYDLYISTGAFFTKMKTFTKNTDNFYDTDTDRFILFKNCNIDLDYFQMYGEIIYNGLS